MHESKNLEIHKNIIMESRSASFFENVFPCLYKEAENTSSLDKDVVQQD